MKHAGAIVLTSVLLVGCQTMTDQHRPSAMETHKYRVNSGALHAIWGAEINSAEVLKRLFADAGVPFPKGSWITYNPLNSNLTVKNTPEALDVFERILTASGSVEMQVRTDVRIIDVIDSSLATKLRDNPVTVSELLSPAFFRRAKIVDTMSVVSISGQQAQVSRVSLPDYLVRSVVTNSVRPHDKVTFLNVTPTVGADGYTVNLTIYLQEILPKPSGSVATTNFSEPPQVAALETSLVLADGDAVAMKLPEQPGHEYHNLWAVVTVRLIDLATGPIRSDRELARKKGILRQQGE